jgi:hypothetical protein
MHIYFYAPKSSRPDQKHAIASIKSTLRQSNLWLSTNTEDEEIQVSAEVLAQTKQSGTPLLERMNAFIIEGTLTDPQTGFFLAHAIAQKKPTLYLYQRGNVPEIFSHLSHKELPKNIRVEAYQLERVEKILLDFLGNIEGSKIKEIPRHKFTLRITDAIEEFLHFKTHNTKVTKADYLREEIEKLMQDDAEWQKFQRKRRDSD